jgi:hypothetical protein
MDDYIKLLEEQNEQLKQSLAVSQRLCDHFKSKAHRLYTLKVFNDVDNSYVISYEHKLLRPLLHKLLDVDNCCNKDIETLQRHVVIECFSGADTMWMFDFGYRPHLQVYLAIFMSLINNHNFKHEFQTYTDFKMKLLQYMQDMKVK